MAVGDWTEQLGKDTQKMGGFFEAISTELTILSTGLTGVKKTMTTLQSEPPKSSLLMDGAKGGKGHSLKDIPSPAQVEGNKDFKYEKDRSAAIEEMNKLSSYYSVSQQAMDRAETQKPTFRPLPDVGVPPPPPGDGWTGRELQTREARVVSALALTTVRASRGPTGRRIQTEPRSAVVTAVL